MKRASHELAVGFLSEIAIRLPSLYESTACARSIRRDLTAFRQGAHVIYQSRRRAETSCLLSTHSRPDANGHHRRSSNFRRRSCLPQTQGARLSARTVTTRLLTRHIREHGPAQNTNARQSCSGTLCKILTAYEIKPPSALLFERRDPLFDEKMAEVLSSTASRVVEAICCRARPETSDCDHLLR